MQSIQQFLKLIGTSLMMLGFLLTIIGIFFLSNWEGPSNLMMIHFEHKGQVYLFIVISALQMILGRAVLMMAQSEASGN